MYIYAYSRKEGNSMVGKNSIEGKQMVGIGSIV